AAFDDAGGWIHTGPPVPVEDQGGSGTRLSHWRESVFGAEVMTGWINAGFNPLSAITIAALRDMGYGVTLDVADPFTVGAAAPPGAAATPALELRELPLPLPPIPIPGGG